MTAYPIARRSFLPFVRFFAKSIQGVERIPTDQPFVLVSNHLGLLDPVFLGAMVISRTKRKLRFLVDTTNTFWHSLGVFLQYWTNTIPVHPDRRGEAVPQAVAAIQRGDCIGIFPEGRVERGTRLLRGHTGAVRISLATGVPILPVGIENTDVPLLTIIGRRFVNRQEGITVRVGEHYRVTGDSNDRGTVRRLTDELMVRIAQLCGKHYDPS